MGNQPSSNPNPTTTTTTTESNPKPSSSSSSSMSLWGCHTKEEQNAKIQHAIQVASNNSNNDNATAPGTAIHRLLSCGFEYRLVHTVPCHCNPDDVGIEAEEGVPEDLIDDDDEEEEEDFDFINDVDENENDIDDETNDDTEFMVPIGVPLHKSLSSHLLLLSENDDAEEEQQPKMSHSTSNLSLFSLTTHLSSTSSQQNNPNHGWNEIMDTSDRCGCALRLVHVPSDTPLNAHNYTHYIAPGPMYDAITDLCTRAAHEYMQQLLGPAHWETVPIPCPTTTTKTKITSSSSSTAFVYRRPTTNRRSDCRKNIFIIITGKGQVRAGIFSRRLLITHGLEAATAMAFLQPTVPNTRHSESDNDTNEQNHSNQYQEQDDDQQLVWDEIWILDPNAQGEQQAYAIVTASLDHIILEQPPSSPQTTTATTHDEDDTPISSASISSPQLYILAHSMAGSQLVRYLHAKMKKQPSSTNDDNNNAQSLSSSVLQSIRAIVFTDSNHNLQWTKTDTPALYDFLQSEACIYMKSISKHEYDASTPTKAAVRSSPPTTSKFALGSVYQGCTFWKHRFGTIQTMYAGTREHALTNYASRHYIWNHFDHCYQKQQQKHPDGFGSSGTADS